MVLSSEITPAEYRYFLVDLLTNQTISEVPFTDVSYERALSKAGSFSGKIPVIAATEGLDLYESTMPGKTAVFVLRNETCVWGGIIWSRQYSPGNKSLTVDASEFVSYLYHRAVWQTLYYGTENVFCSKYSANGTTATVFTDVPHGFQQGEVVRIKNLNAALNGDRVITAITTASFSFAVSGVTLALSPSSTGVARVVLDAYETTRQILGWVLQDFGGQGFINDDIRPANEIEYSITNKQASSIGGGESRFTLTTANVHDFIEGQEIEIVDVDAGVNGFQIIDTIPTSTSISVVVPGSLSVAPLALSGLTTINVISSGIDTTELTVTTKQVVNNVATLTTSSSHGLAVGDYVSIGNISNSVT